MFSKNSPGKKWSLIGFNHFSLLTEQRKHYTKTSINSLTDTSQYHVEVSSRSKVTSESSSVDQDPAPPWALFCFYISDSLSNSALLSPEQHLTTFVLDRKDGMITVDDGIRRLRLLDAKGKVWTQEMLLQVEEKSVTLIDQETKVSSVQTPAELLFQQRLGSDPTCLFRTTWRTSPLGRYNTVRLWWTPAATTPSWLWCVRSLVKLNRTSTCFSVTTSRWETTTVILRSMHIL